MNTFYIYFFILFCISYLIITDQLVAKAFILVYELIKFHYYKTKFWLIHNPANPIVKYFMWRRAYKLAKELQDEFENRNK